MDVTGGPELPTTAAGWRALADAAPVAMSLIGPDGRQWWRNRAFERLFRLAPDAPLHVTDITDTDELRWTEDYLQRLANGEVEHLETVKVYRRGDGTTFVGRLTAQHVSDPPGGLIGVIVPTHDEAANLSPSTSTAKYRRVFEAQRELVCEWDENDVVLFCNRAYREFFGYGDEVIGRTLTELIPAGARTEGVPPFEQYAHGDHPTTCLRRYDDGRVVEWLDTALLDEDGSVLSVLSVGRDVTARIQAEEELERRRDEAEAALRRQIAFIAHVSHELRNPLHGMVGLSELLAGDDLSPDAAAMARAIHAQSSTLRRIVDDLLDLQQLELGRVQLVEEDVDLAEVVGEVLAVARSAPGNAAIAIEEVWAPTTPRWIRNDSDRLRQVLTNLVANACKYTGEGSVRVRVGPSDDGRRVAIEVSDDGPGIDAADLHRIFVPYERGRGHRSTSAGLGLGLAIARGLVEAMGGTIAVSSALGHGATFRVVLPAGAAAEPADATPLALAAVGAVPRVLVVEDDEVNRFLARHQLQRLGAEPHLADDGEAALALLETETFDVVFLDVQLPGISGLDVARRLRGMAGRPFVAGMTASATVADRQACFDAGMDAFVAKPATLNDLRSVLEQAALDAR